MLTTDCIKFISLDETTNTIVAEGLGGSVTLDIIPAAYNFMKANPDVNVLLLKKLCGRELRITQESTIEDLVKEWINKAHTQTQPSQPGLGL